MTSIQRLSTDLMNMRFQETDTLQECQEQWHAVLRKHGIKQGTPAYNDAGERVGLNCNNYEWTICKDVFIARIADFFALRELFADVPPDLQF